MGWLLVLWKGEMVVWEQNEGEGESYHGLCPFIPRVEGLWWS
jgi:hypothetical protein